MDGMDGWDNWTDGNWTDRQLDSLLFVVVHRNLGSISSNLLARYLTTTTV